MFDLCWADDADFLGALACIKRLPADEIVARGKQPMQGFRLWKQMPIPDESGAKSGRTGYCAVRDFPGAILLEPYKLKKDCQHILDLARWAQFTVQGNVTFATLDEVFYTRPEIIQEGQRQLKQELEAVAAGEAETPSGPAPVEILRRYQTTCAHLMGFARPERLDPQQLADLVRAGMLMGKRLPDLDRWQTSFEMEAPPPQEYSDDIREVYAEAVAASMTLAGKKRA